MAFFAAAWRVEVVDLGVATAGAVALVAASAVLRDAVGAYVFVVGADGKVAQKRVVTDAQQGGAVGGAEAFKAQAGAARFAVVPQHGFFQCAGAAVVQIAFALADDAGEAHAPQRRSAQPVVGLRRPRA